MNVIHIARFSASEAVRSSSGGHSCLDYSVHLPSAMLIAPHPFSKQNIMHSRKPSLIGSESRLNALLLTCSMNYG